MKKIRESFKIAYEDIAIDSFMKRYHFEEKDRNLLDAACRFLTELIEVETGILLEKDRAVCLVTLGKRYDELSDMTAEAGHLLLSYSLECLGMEILSRAYEKINELVFHQSGKWLGEYYFLGDENIEDLAACLSAFDGLSVTWEKGMLHPLKSVVFMAEYREKKDDSGCHNCERCKNITCSFRNITENKQVQNTQTKTVDMKVYSYGISQILGNGKKG